MRERPSERLPDDQGHLGMVVFNRDVGPLQLAKLGTAQGRSKTDQQ